MCGQAPRHQRTAGGGPGLPGHAQGPPVRLHPHGRRQRCSCPRGDLGCVSHWYVKATGVFNPLPTNDAYVSPTGTSRLPVCLTLYQPMTHICVSHWYVKATRVFNPLPTNDTYMYVSPTGTSRLPECLTLYQPMTHIHVHVCVSHWYVKATRVFNPLPTNDTYTCTVEPATSSLFLKLHPRALLKFVLLTLCSTCIITIIE